VHGYTGNASNWVTAMSVFRSAGYSSDQLFAYEYNSYGDNTQNAVGLASYVNQVKARTGASQVDIVNHSMGGLVSQYYLKVLNGSANVAHLASIAGANHGTTLRQRLHHLRDLSPDAPRLLVHPADHRR
jgi:triacylglycerol lipase